MRVNLLILDFLCKIKLKEQKLEILAWSQLVPLSSLLQIWLLSDPYCEGFLRLKPWKLNGWLGRKSCLHLVRKSRQEGEWKALRFLIAGKASHIVCWQVSTYKLVNLFLFFLEPTTIIWWILKKCALSSCLLIHSTVVHHLALVAWMESALHFITKLVDFIKKTLLEIYHVF